MMDLTQKITIGIAIYGALLSTIMGIFKIINDKKKIKVSVSLAFFHYPNGNLGDDLIAFKAVNISKRPIILTGAGIKFKNNGNLFFIDNTNLPKKLLEGESHEIYRSLESLKQDIKNPNELISIWFKDTTGKEYKINGRKLRKILK